MDKWHIKESRRGVPSVVDKDGKTICMFDWRNYLRAIAYARVIVSIPDFVNALKLAVPALKAAPRTERNQAALDAIESALTKALGKEHFDG